MRDRIICALLPALFCATGLLFCSTWMFWREWEDAKAALRAATGGGASWSYTCTALRSRTDETASGPQHETALECWRSVVIVPAKFAVGQSVTVYAVGR